LRSAVATPPCPRAWRPLPSLEHPSPAGARHSEMTANLLTGKGPNFREFSEWALIDHANQSDLQSAPFATRDTPPERGFLSHRSTSGNSDVIRAHPPPVILNAVRASS
jgi:hypothetical protein